jgi:hypothetical protein
MIVMWSVLKKSIVAMLVVVLLLGVSNCKKNQTNPELKVAETTEILTSMETFSTENEVDKELDEELASMSEPDPLRYREGPFEGMPIPADIKGSYTLAQTADLYNIPLLVISEAFMVPLELLAYVRNGDLKNLYSSLISLDKELGNGSVTMFVSMYNGIPFEAHEPTWLLESGVTILKKSGKLTTEDFRYIDAHTVYLSEIVPVDWAGFQYEEKNYDSTTDSGTLAINAKTTFRQVLEAGISAEQVMEILGTTELPDPDELIRSYCVLNKLQFSFVKEELLRLLSSK